MTGLSFSYPSLADSWSKKLSDTYKQTASSPKVQPSDAVPVAYVEAKPNGFASTQIGMLFILEQPPRILLSV